MTDLITTTTFAVTTYELDPFTQIVSLNGVEFAKADLIDSAKIKVKDLTRSQVMSATGEAVHENGIDVLFQRHGSVLNCRGNMANFKEQFVFLSVLKLHGQNTLLEAATQLEPHKETQINTDKTQGQINLVFKALKIDAKPIVGNNAVLKSLQVTTYCYTLTAIGQVKKVLANEIEFQNKLKEDRVCVWLDNGVLKIEVPTVFDSKKTPLFFDAKNMDSKCAVPIYLGLSTNGKHVTVDMADHEMAHALVAGQSGSGKSVGINTMIAGLRLQQNVEFLLLDGKMVEFAEYDSVNLQMWNGYEVINYENDAYDAIAELQAEMYRRNNEMAKSKVKNITYTNMKHIVLIIDEFLVFFRSLNTMEIMTEKKKKNGSIDTQIKEINTGKETCKMIENIAKLGRNSGIHLILSTQQPSAAVMSTGLRSQLGLSIGFYCPTSDGSEMILQDNSATKLIGGGDCIVKYKNYKHRCQSAIVDNKKFPTFNQTELFQNEK